LLFTLSHQDSAAYEAFCKSINSGVLVHYNLLGMLDTVEEKQQRYAAAYKLYELAFPPTPVAEIWPAPIAAPALAPPAGHDAAGSIIICVRAYTGEETHIRLKPHHKMSKIFTAYAAHVNVCIGSLRFLLDGVEHISGESTVQQVGLEEGDVIDALLEQGGC
jgi:Ubiquitin-2 like Rad60 SUMO-like